MLKPIGSRDAEKEITTGFISLHKIHNSAKTYNRNKLKKSE